MADPLYDKIVAGLEALGDGNKFEACANSLLRAKYPWLTWIQGGNDAGFDGTGVRSDGKRVQLITTTQDDVIGNLTSSLEQSAKMGRPSDLVLVATSRALSAERKRNIEDRIKEFSKAPLPIEDQPTVAELLYHNSRWRIELLGIPGDPPALTRLPASDRVYLPIPPLGRDNEIRSLVQATGDLVVFGQPGSGKTHLLGHVAKSTDGLFLAASEPRVIADAIRDQRPAWIIVDDAFSRRELVRTLRQIRADIGATFRIVASCWPGQQDEVARSLGTIDQQLLEMDLLPQSVIKDIIVTAGIGGPDDLLWELIHQAGGRPGLAVTLARLCMREKLRDVLSGKALAQDVKHSLTEMAGAQAVDLLSFFALAGNSGLDVETAARIVEMRPIEVRRTAETLGAAGVLEVVVNGRLAVEPTRLRQALVSEVFCSTTVPLDWQRFLDSMPHRGDALATIICGRMLGGTLDELKIQAEIVSLSRTGQDFFQACESYAHLGREQSLWVLQQFPQLVERLAGPFLDHAPRECLPFLLKADRDTETHAFNSRERLKAIRKWIDEVGDRPGTVRRRELLLAALEEMRGELAESTTPLAALAAIFALRFEWMSHPPGQPAVLTIRSGPVHVAALPAIAAFWPGALPFLREQNATNVGMISEIVRDWVFPEGRQRTRVALEYIETCKRHGAAMVRDLVAAYADRWAMLRQLAHLAATADVPLPTAPASISATLFPTRSIEDEMNPPQSQFAAARALAAEWTKVGPTDEIIDSWLTCEREAHEAGVTYPNLGFSVVAPEIATNTSEPDRWLQALLEKEASSGLIEPFASRACSESTESLAEFVTQRIEDDTYGMIAALCLVRFSDPSQTFWATHSNALSKHAHVIGVAALRNQLPEVAVRWLLENNCGAATREVAANLWSADPRGEIPDHLIDCWRRAVVENLEDDHEWSDIAPRFPDLACAWLKKRVNQTWKDRLEGVSDYTQNHYIREIIGALSTDQRRDVIEHFHEDNFHDDVLGLLIGIDLDLLRFCLSRPATRELAVRCVGTPRQREDWAERAAVFLECGVTLEEVFVACSFLAEAWTGPTSQHYEGHRAAFAKYLTHPNHGIRAIGRIADQHYGKLRDDERRRERIAAVKGTLI